MQVSSSRSRIERFSMGVLPRSGAPITWSGNFGSALCEASPTGEYATLLARTAEGRARWMPSGGARSLSEPLRKQPDQRFSHSPIEGGYEWPPRAERSDSSRRLAFHSFIPASTRCSRKLAATTDDPAQTQDLLAVAQGWLALARRGELEQVSADELMKALDC
jgi:hypothetical protein